MPRSRIIVTTTGPLFQQAKAAGIMQDFLAEAKDEVAQQGLRMLRVRMAATFRHPTGAYESRVVVDRAARASDRVITDGFVIYGSWLEGTSTRNRSTRFKGYKDFRKTRLQLRREVVPIVQEILNRHLRRLG
jgi:hypothetical protein